MSGQAIDFAGVAGASASSTMTCPKCGFTQPEGAECLGCGVFVAKYVEGARRAEEARLIQASVAERQQAYVQTPVEHGASKRTTASSPPKRRGSRTGWPAASP